MSTGLAAKSRQLVDLSELLHVNSSVLLALREYDGPTGSHKDRLYEYAVSTLYDQGAIAHGDRLIDFSSGNAGAALAFQAATRGFECTIVRPAGLSAMKAMQIRLFGADLEITPAEQGVAGAESKALALAKRPGCVLVHQTETHLNVDCFAICGNEITGSAKSLGVAIHGFACGIGTGGLFTGIGRTLRADWPEMKIATADVSPSNLISSHLCGNPCTLFVHPLEGLVPGMLFPNTDLSLINNCFAISADEAISASLELCRRGHFVGPSSGFNLCIARRLAAELPKNSVIVTVLCDAAWKYPELLASHV